MNRNKENKGITLIALVVTVVVLLILAGITISLIFGEDSIFETANKSKIDTIHAKVYDTIGTMSQDYYIKSQAGLSTSNTLLDYLTSKQIIGENNVVNTEKLFGKKETLGNGTLNTGDIYVIEKEETSDKTKYKLVYYEKNNENNKNLGYLPGDATQGSGGSEEDESRDWAKYFTYELNEETKTATVTGVKEEYQIIGYYWEIYPYVYGMKDGDTVITDIVIPSHIQEKNASGTETSYTVVEIGDKCFGRNEYTEIEEPKGFKSFRLPNTIERIGEEAFHGCTSLTSINIPDSVTSIGNNTFAFCSSLTSINIPNSVTSIGSGAFYECSSLTSINIPSSVTSIGSRAFVECRGLTNINIPSSVTSIGEIAFAGCSGLTSINIPSSVTSIGEYAFSGCSGLTEINCQASSKPSGWSDNWNSNCNATVNWGVSM